MDGAKIKSKIIIPAGHELDITNCTLHFGYSRDLYDYNSDLVNNVLTPVGIDIQPGGRLVLNGATLIGINSCNGRAEMWDGITAEGNPNALQTSQFQGYVSMTNSTIQNAVEGINVGGTYFGSVTSTCGCTGCPVCPTGATWTEYKSEYATSTGAGGGLVQTSGSTFKDDRKDVAFFPFTYTGSASYFTGTTFTSTAPLVDPSYVDGAGRGLGASAHVSMDDIHNIYFNGCTFTSATSFTEDLRGTGISSFDASYYVNKNPYTTPCTFSNLDTAISAAGSMASVGTYIDAEQNIFTNCRHGVNL